MSTNRIPRIPRFAGPTRWASNFYVRPLTVRGTRFPASENAFQALKARDPERYWPLFTRVSPNEAKRIGGIHGGMPIRPAWNTERVAAMREVQYAKYTEHADLRCNLLWTGDSILEEGNTWGDTFWGKVDGLGENHLGRALMDLRTYLRQTSAPTLEDWLTVPERILE